MLVKFNCSNGSFLNPLNWWRIRFGCTALDQCYWNKENWFANWCVGWPRAWSAAGEILLQLILYVNAPPNIKQTILCIQGDSTACHQITKLRLWPLDHSSSDLWSKRERLNVDQLWAGDRCILRRHSPVPEIKYSRQKTTRVDWRKDSAHIGEYNASHYWIFYQNKKQMCRMLRIINTFQKKNFRRSWKILHGSSWVTFGFPRLFLYWYLWKCVHVF
jgi:hypothetical protein